MKCKKCGAENLDGAKFCSSCGSKLETNICPKCGTANKDDARFCSLCGASLEKEEVFEAEPQFESNSTGVATKRCRICGFENKADEKYCQKCGSQLSEIKEGDGLYTNQNQSIYKQTTDEGGPGFVIGIVSIVCSILCCLFFVGIIGGICGIVLNALALKKKTYNRGKAMAGLICSIIAVAIGLFVLFDIIVALNNPEFWEQYNQIMQEYQNGAYGN